MPAAPRSARRSARAARAAPRRPGVRRGGAAADDLACRRAVRRRPAPVSPTTTRSPPIVTCGRSPSPSSLRRAATSSSVNVLCARFRSPDLLQASVSSFGSSTPFFGQFVDPTRHRTVPHLDPHRAQAPRPVRPAHRSICGHAQRPRRPFALREARPTRRLRGADSRRVRRDGGSASIGRHALVAHDAEQLASAARVAPQPMQVRIGTCRLALTLAPPTPRRLRPHAVRSRAARSAPRVPLRPAAAAAAAACRLRLASILFSLGARRGRGWPESSPARYRRPRPAPPRRTRRLPRPT